MIGQLISGTIVVVTCLLAVSTPAQEEQIYRTNFDIQFTVGAEAHQVRTSANLRSGSTVPIDFQNYKVELRMSDKSSGNYSLDVGVFEKSGSGWYQVNVPTPSFEGEYGIPTQFIWQLDDIKVDLAIVIGPAAQIAR